MQAQCMRQGLLLSCLLSSLSSSALSKQASNIRAANSEPSGKRAKKSNGGVIHVSVLEAGKGGVQDRSTVSFKRRMLYIS